MPDVIEEDPLTQVLALKKILTACIDLAVEDLYSSNPEDRETALFYLNSDIFVLDCRFTGYNPHDLRKIFLD